MIEPGTCSKGGTASAWIQVYDCHFQGGIMTSYDPGRPGFFIECGDFDL